MRGDQAMLCGLWGVFFGLTLLARPSLGCSCSLMHPQQLFCNADYAIKAEVLDTELVVPEVEVTSETGEVVTHEGPARRRYSVRIHKIFKAHESITMEENKTFNYIHTSSNGGLCGVHLDVGSRYMMTGHVTHAGEAHTGLCDLVELWDEMSSQQRKGVSYKYNSSCDCTVRHCFQPKCDTEQDDEDSCSWSIRNDRGMCYLRHTHCKRHNETGNCHWAAPNDFRLCKESAKKARWNEP